MSVGSRGRPIPHLNAQLPSSGWPVHHVHGTCRQPVLHVCPWAVLCGLYNLLKMFFDKKDLAQTSPGPGPKAHAE